MKTQATGKTSRPAALGSSATQSAQGAEFAVARFLRSFQALLGSSRLYQKNHPLVLRSLEAAESHLQEALRRVPALTVSVERGRLFFCGRALNDPRAELKTLAEDLSRQGISNLVFLQGTHLGEISLLAQMLVDAAARPAAPAVSPTRGAISAEAQSDGQWTKLLEAHRVQAIRINHHPDRKAADTFLISLVAGVLRAESPVSLGRAAGAAPGGTPDATRGKFDARTSPGRVETAMPRTLDESTAALRLLGQIAALLAESGHRSPTEIVETLRSAVAEADSHAVRIIAATISCLTPGGGEDSRAFVSRLAEKLVLDFVEEQFRAGRVAAPELRPLCARLARELLLPGGGSAEPRNNHAWLADALGNEESYAEHLHARFWARLPARQLADVLRSPHSWCVSISSLQQYLEELVDQGEEREARSLLLSYARGLESREASHRLATAVGLSEVVYLLEQLWPGKSPEELNQWVLQALITEPAPEVAGVLAAVLDNLAWQVTRVADYPAFERLLAALDSRGRGADHAHLATVAERILADARWQILVDAALAPANLDPSLPRILGRDPERLLDRLDVLLAGPKGLELLPAMARLLDAIGEPAFGAAVARLFDPRAIRATSSAKLLAVTQPERLMESLPRALPSWDWNLQDLAVSELVKLGVPGCARAFLELLPLAHALVVPMMLDQIALENETAAVPLLLEIAAGQSERWKDVFVRIKAIEALGRMRAREAAGLLRTIVRQRTGLTHVEPAGIRAAAEEALGLIENRPSSVRVRTAHEAVEKASVSYTRPRRYLRIPLDTPLAARIGAQTPAAVRVRTISLGGAFLEARRRLNVGESFSVEIRAGLRRIQGMAVVRNVAPGGGGIEFVHMRQDDREKLRRLISRLLRA